MVIGTDEIPKQKKPLLKCLAQPQKRLAAFVVDYFVVTPPILLFLLAPLESQLTMAGMMGQDYRAGLILAAISVMTLVYTFLYHFICYQFMSATLGQRFMKLKVVQIHSGQPVDTFQALARSFYFCINSILLFVGSLGIYSNKKRQTIYDRLTETQVISLDESQAVGAPTESSRTLVLAAYGFFASFIVFVASAGFYLAMSYPFDERRLVESLQAEGKLCEEISENIEAFNHSELDYGSRLEVATSLYFSGEIDLSCMQAELNPKLIMMSEDHLYHFTKFLVHLNEPGLASAYHAANCEMAEQSSQCQLGHMIQSVFKDDWSGFPEMYDSLMATGEVQPSYVYIWMSEKLLQLEKFKQAQALLEKVPDISSIATQRAYLQIKNYIGEGSINKAKGALSVVRTQLATIEEGELLAGLCSKSLEHSCSTNKTQDCLKFMNWTSNNKRILDLQSSLTYIQSSTCSNSLESLAGSEAATLLHHDAMKLLNALIIKDPDYLVQITEDLNYSSAVRLYAMEKLLEWAPEDASWVRAEIMSLKSQPGAERLGRYLLRKWNQDRQYENLSQYLEQKKSLWGEHTSIETKHLLVSEYRLGRYEKAKSILNELDIEASINGLVPGGRQPASVPGSLSIDDEIKMIIEDLK